MLCFCVCVRARARLSLADHRHQEVQGLPRVHGMDPGLLPVIEDRKLVMKHRFVAVSLQKRSHCCGLCCCCRLDTLFFTLKESSSALEENELSLPHRRSAQRGGHDRHLRLCLRRREQVGPYRERSLACHPHPRRHHHQALFGARSQGARRGGHGALNYEFVGTPSVAAFRRRRRSASAQLGMLVVGGGITNANASARKCWSCKFVVGQGKWSHGSPTHA